ncbi:MAG: outer membrane protein assembly factor BamA [Phycisphaerales bacterium]
MNGRSRSNVGPAGSHGPRARRAGAVTLGALCLAMLWAPLPRAHAQNAQPAPEPAAQPQDDLSVYEGRVIHDVLLVKPTDDGASEPITGPTRQKALNNIRAYPGAPFRLDTVNDDVRRLNRLALFARVEVFVQLLADGAVDVTFSLVERPVIVDVQISGNRRLSDQQIGEQVDLLVGAPIDRFQVDRAARRIEDLYREKGYYFAQVSVDEDELERSGVVLFRIREGQRLKVTAIRFEGSTAFSDKQLRREIDTKTSGLLRKGQLDDDVLDADIAALIQFYRNNGYLDVRADTLVQPSPNGKEAIVTYLIEEGPLYTLRSVEFKVEDGQTPVYSQEQIAGLIPLKPGDVYGVRALQESLNAVRDAYNKLGYPDVSVGNVEKRDPQQPLVDLVILVSQGDRFLTGEVLVTGNELTKQKVVRKLLDIRPERPLDMTAVRRSEKQVRESRLFDPQSVKITLQPPDPAEPEYRDVLVEVAETNTGSFNIGAAINSDAGVIGTISLTQRNFDIADTPDSWGELFTGRAFRGAGQTFKIELLPGNQVQTYSVSLTEPYLFDSDYSGTVQLSYRDRDYDEFDERRLAARFGVGRKFGTRWTGSIGLRVEQVELSNIAPSRTTDVFAAMGPDVITGVGFTLSRNTLDDRFRPTKGSVTSIGVEQVGAAGGDYFFTRFDASHSVYLAIREDYLNRSTVLELRGRVGYIPQGRGDVPTYERFYLGGQSMRGLEFRTVSPKGIRNDTLMPSNDPVGGTWLFFAGAQVTQPIFEEVFSVVFFVDSGTVTFDPGFDDYRVTVGAGLRFYVPQLSPAPLAFDFGFPVLKGDRDENRLFTFSIDLPF